MKSFFAGRMADILVFVGVVGLLSIMIVPLPSFMLDLLLSTNIAFSLVILLVALTTRSILEFNLFPTILLLATLFRLSLNVASTRLILLHGQNGTVAAGHVIESFGRFVIGGSYAVGLVIFLIFVVINFVVVTRGAGRIAEVAARFTLDALPGKQMAIDADLNSGAIKEEEARKRRKDLTRESEFYGAMDGASKFVRGDAIAAVLILFINIVGGLIIGTVLMGMPVGDALQVYTLLTIGEGLVAQIPALIVSVAAGIVVTRSSSQNELGKDMQEQVFSRSRALGGASAILLFLAAVPGLPHLAFLMMGGLIGGAAMSVSRSRKKTEDLRKEEEAKAPPPAENIEQFLALDMLEINVGYGLVSLVEGGEGGDLTERIKGIRRQLAGELGIIIPPIHIRDNLQLKPEEYMILLKGNPVGRWELKPGFMLAMNAGGGGGEGISGIPVKEPTFGLPARWISPDMQEAAESEGLTVVDPVTVLATHLTEILRSHADELVGRQETQRLLDALAKDYPKLVEDLVPGQINLGTLVSVLHALLSERVSIRDMRTILESLSDQIAAGRDPKDVSLLAEGVRQSLGRTIVNPYLVGRSRQLPVISFDGRWEELLQKTLSSGGGGTGRPLALDPGLVQKLLTNLGRVLETQGKKGVQAVLLVAPQARFGVRRLVERYFPSLPVLSPQEIPADISIQSSDVVRYQEA
ncbi:MAG: flagellar biosynthesis protein FlhA [Leptospirillia bacterium]